MRATVKFWFYRDVIEETFDTSDTRQAEALDVKIALLMRIRCKFAVEYSF